MAHQEKTGIWASLSRVLATVLDMAQVRLDLLGTELEFEKQRLLTALWLGALSLVLLGLGLVLLCATLGATTTRGCATPASGAAG